MRMSFENDFYTYPYATQFTIVTSLPTFPDVIVLIYEDIAMNHYVLPLEHKTLATVSLIEEVTLCGRTLTLLALTGFDKIKSAKFMIDDKSSLR